MQYSCKISNILINEFLVGGGYTFLNKFLLYLEGLHEPSQAVHYSSCLAATVARNAKPNITTAHKQLRLLDLISSMVFIGYEALSMPEVPPSHNEDTMPAHSGDTSGGSLFSSLPPVMFVGPLISASSLLFAAACVRNIDALLALQNYFIGSKSDVLKEKVSEEEN